MLTFIGVSDTGADDILVSALPRFEPLPFPLIATRTSTAYNCCTGSFTA
jgi:hypothetical protein